MRFAWKRDIFQLSIGQKRFHNRQGSPEKLYFFFNEDPQGKPDAYLSVS
jgi:hypothetical protein